MDITSLDPRARLATAVAAAFLFSMVQTRAVLFAGSAGTILLICLAEDPFLMLFKRLAPANFFLLFLVVTVPWSMPGTPAWELGPFSFSREGVELILQAAVKCNCILAVFLVLAADMEIADMGAALEQLHMPPKLVFLFLFTFRHIHVIEDEWKRMRTAAALRGFRPKTSMHTYRTIAHMLGMVIVNSMDRSRRIYEAMQLRGFHGVFHTATEPGGGGIVFFSCVAASLVALTAADLIIR